MWLAPLREGGSYVALKALPLLLPMAGILAGSRRTYQWSSMLILGYVAEGAARTLSDAGPSRALAALEFLLSVAFFCAVVAYARLTRPAASPPHR